MGKGKAIFFVMRVEHVVGTQCERGSQDEDEPMLSIEAWEVRAGRTVLFTAHDLALRSGETLYVVGPSGAGKTTFLRSMAGLNSSGVTTVASAAQEAATTVMYVGGAPRFLGGQTVEAVIRFHVAHSNDVVSAGEWAAALALGSCLTHDVATCSTGELRRLQILCALSRCPSILLLDEPTSGLSGVEADLLMRTVHSLHQRRSVAVVAVLHQPRRSVMELCDRVLVCCEGELRRDVAFSTLVEEFGNSGNADSVMEQVLDDAARRWTPVNLHTILPPHTTPSTQTQTHEGGSDARPLLCPPVTPYRPRLPPASTTAFRASLLAGCRRDLVTNWRARYIYVAHYTSLSFIVTMLVLVYGSQDYEDVEAFVIQNFLLFATFLTYFGFTKMAMLRQERNVLVGERYARVVTCTVHVLSRWPAMCVYTLWCTLTLTPYILWGFELPLTPTMLFDYGSLLWLISLNGFALRWAAETALFNIDTASAVTTGVTCVFTLMNGVLTERDRISPAVRWATNVSPVYYVLSALGNAQFPGEFDDVSTHEARGVLTAGFVAFNVLLWWNVRRLGRWERCFR